MNIGMTSRLFLLLFLTVMVTPAANADLTVYPKPPHAVKSSVFSLEVDGRDVPVIQHMDYHYAPFAFTGTVDVRIRCSDPVTDHAISPLSLGVEADVSGREVSFAITQCEGENGTPRYLVVQINALETLVILGDLPEPSAPPSSGPGIFNVVKQFGADPTGLSYTQPAIQDAIDAASTFGSPTQPGVVYVPAGTYQVRANLAVKDNVDLYLAPGAALKADDNASNYTIKGSGTIAPVLLLDGASNVTIRGRGEVDASGVALMDLLSQTPPILCTQSKAHPRRRVIQSSDKAASRNVQISGIVVKDGTGWSVDLVNINGVVLQNVKVLNHRDIQWKIQNDGINATSSSNVLVNQCFVMTIDDALCSKAQYAAIGSMDNVVFANNVLWTWAAGVKAGMQNDHPMNGVVFRNIDIVHCRRGIAVDTKTSQDSGKEIPISNVEFRDIRVDDIEGHWSMSNHDAVEFLLEDAPARGIIIRNFSLPKKRPLRCGPTYSAEGVTFYNFVMEGEPITDISQVTLKGKQSIRDLTFHTEGSVTDSGGK